MTLLFHILDLNEGCHASGYFFLFLQNTYAFFLSIVHHNERIPCFSKSQVLLKQNLVKNVSFTAWFESETLGTQISFANSSCEIQNFVTTITPQKEEKFKLAPVSVQIRPA
jgi:hypothetical protein